jgi:hypothetical protein
MLAASTSQTPVNFYLTTRCNNPEDSHLKKKNFTTEPENLEEQRGFERTLINKDQFA